MVLVAKEMLDKEDTSQEAISALPKENLINTILELRENFEKNGVLLLNTALVFTDKKSSSKHIKAWRPFVSEIIKSMDSSRCKLILFGTHAKDLKKHFDLSRFETIELEHPYNHTFIHNKQALKLFKPMHLLEK